MKKHLARSIQAFVLLLALIVSGNAAAQSLPGREGGGPAAGIMAIHDQIETSLPEMVEGLMGNPNPYFSGPRPPQSAFAEEYQSIWKLIFAFMAFLALFFALRDYILEGSLNSLLERVVMVALIWVILLQFPVILGAVHDFQQGVANAFQRGILQDANANGLEDVVSAVGEYIRPEDSMPAPDTSGMGWIEQIGAKIEHWTATAGFTVMRWMLIGLSYVLMVLAFGGQVFGSWGFYVVGIFGPLLIPLYLVRTFSGVADGWFRSMATMFVYGIVIRVIICMIAWGFGAITDLPSSGNLFTQGFVEFIGVFVWISFGILMLLKAEAIAQGLTSGAGTTAASGAGLAGGLRGFATNLARGRGA